MTEVELWVDDDGVITFIHDDDVAEALAGHAADTRRASHVEPVPGTGQWSADMAPVGGPVLGPFGTRREALAAEVRWLRDMMARGPVRVAESV